MLTTIPNPRYIVVDLSRWFGRHSRGLGDGSLQAGSRGRAQLRVIVSSRSKYLGTCPPCPVAIDALAPIRITDEVKDVVIGVVIDARVVRVSYTSYHEATTRAELVDERRVNGVDEEPDERVDVLVPQISQLCTAHDARLLLNSHARSTRTFIIVITFCGSRRPVSYTHLTLPTILRV